MFLTLLTPIPSGSKYSQIWVLANHFCSQIHSHCRTTTLDLSASTIGACFLNNFFDNFTGVSKPNVENCDCAHVHVHKVLKNTENV